VIVGLDPERGSAKQARADGMTVVSPAEAAKQADWIQILTPDETQAELLPGRGCAAPDGGQDSRLLCTGFSIHFKSIVAPKDVDVVMNRAQEPRPPVAPRICRRPWRARVDRHSSGWPAAAPRNSHSAMRAASVRTRAGVIETTFKEETETDLFGEQAVLCGGLTSLIKKGFETLVEAGYQPEIAYFECLHEMKLIVDLIYEGGLAALRYSISNTAEYGDLTRGNVVVNDQARESMKNVLKADSGRHLRQGMDMPRTRTAAPTSLPFARGKAAPD